ILREVKLIAAEDTRRTKKLLAAYDIKTPLTSYHSHSRKTKVNRIIQVLTSQDVALVSDAGMPGVSDPGYELVKAAVEANIPVVPIPGPSVIVTALAVSALPASKFLYLGF
ncbi:MAG: 16S rRNA (cytidine(1402)-2'-O)-methyltransferase, partial [Aliifodinibius sp.]|nr:16S rRNA (cytidine(1402)-2'-O)-methyltransferase [candidate division Zixibacteria bacterium]NIR62216.1 16S rRNA (cytidine(1402)-2'-O)-methyltransferase [candidate division Zixibacteria bacterium]NIT57201.1 16S rRNA (cytidine(1402)-2'-O)-methyltransferase [Fodinibius sp.]NIW98600.1 16S rRNA (cytidine(1402)-2'-O)-methyltransferase [Phycisphaerae bacterium]NIY25783.1 16S rRNA (cytidine(1402)-2'-O)-methyltransferase [Fodinibius sp.]